MLMVSIDIGDRKSDHREETLDLDEREKPLGIRVPGLRAGR